MSVTLGLGDVLGAASPMAPHEKGWRIQFTEPYGSQWSSSVPFPTMAAAVDHAVRWSTEDDAAKPLVYFGTAHR